MHEDLKLQILEKYNVYKNAILEEVEEYAYRNNRYNVNFTIALFISDKKLDLNLASKTIRDTDKAIVLEDNFLATVFDFSDSKSGFKAAENLLSKLEPQVFGGKIFVSIVSSEDSIDDDEQIRKALNILIDEISKKLDGIPISEENHII